MPRIVFSSCAVAIYCCVLCETGLSFAQEDSNASIMATLDGNASEMAFSAGNRLPPRRNLGVTSQPSALKGPSYSRPSQHRDNPVTGHSVTGRAGSIYANRAFQPFGLPPNYGGLSNSVFRVYGQGYGFGYSFNYFGNYGQGYGTGYSPNYFGNYGNGYGTGYWPKQ